MLKAGAIGLSTEMSGMIFPIEQRSRLRATSVSGRDKIDTGNSRLIARRSSQKTTDHTHNELDASIPSSEFGPGKKGTIELRDHLVTEDGVIGQ